MADTQRHEGERLAAAARAEITNRVTEVKRRTTAAQISVTAGERKAHLRRYSATRDRFPEGRYAPARK